MSTREKHRADRFSRDRRDVLTLLGVGAAGFVPFVLSERTQAQTRTNPCIVRPSQTQGPYFVDERLHRPDIRIDPATGIATPGVPLELTFNVWRAGTANCAPLANAQVDVWQCDASGAYSDVVDPGFDTRGSKFLRGYQMTDSSGAATFQTIYPGWYQGRAVHIHFKIRHAAGERAVEFTSQLYFDDALSDAVHATSAYSGKGVRDVRNGRDGIYARGGRELTLAPVRRGAGYGATFDVGLYV